MQGFSEIELLNINNDDLVMKHLWFICMDIYDYPFIYVPSKHRNLRNQVVLGYQVFGEVRCDAAFKQGPFASLCSRLIIASYQDVSLMKEMAELACKTRDYNGYSDDGMPEEPNAKGELPETELEEGWREVEKIIESMEELRDRIRGPAHGPSGSLKLASEYKSWLEEKELIMEKYDC